MAEVFQRLLEEDLRRRVAQLITPLAVEGMDEHPPCSAPAIVAQMGQPFGHDPRLARAALSMEHEDAHSLGPRPIEHLQLRLPPGEPGTVGAQHLEAVGRKGSGHAMG
jgi:hypothetical protein